jgi:hypothetical protein
MRSLLAAVASVMLMGVGAALAANSASFIDPAGDIRGAPDITRISVSSNDSGTVKVRVIFANRRRLRASEELGVGIDVDQDPDTGSVYYGQEYSIWLKVGRAVLYRAVGSGRFEVGPPPDSLQGSFTAGVATFSFKAADLGIARGSGFNLSVIDTAHSRYMDSAPDVGTFNYQLVRGTTPRPRGPDTRAPLDEARPSRGAPGKTARLAYLASDGRGVTADTVRIYRGRRVLNALRTALSAKNPFFPHSVSWRVPPTIRGRLRFCVTSRDAAGNRSNTSCARLIVPAQRRRYLHT